MSTSARWVVCWVGLHLLGISVAAAQPYPSRLSATAQDPLYTTYAAPLQRSTFVAEQGYQFRFFTEQRGLFFKTADAGNLSMAFKLDDRVHYFRRQMRTAPEITVSYPDLVTYRYRPYQGIQVHSTFQVYSSQLAVQEITVTNSRSEAVTLDAYPFFQHGQGIHDVHVSADQQHVTFRHGALPEGWTRRHEIPHADSLTNVFLLDAPADAFGVYGALGPLDEEPTMRSRSAQAGQNVYVKEGGTVRREDGTLCLATPPEASMVAFYGGSREELLTEEVPNRRGSGTNIPGDGTQELELIHFARSEVAPGDSFEVIFQCGEQQASATRVIPEMADSVVTDLQLADSLYVPPPQNLTMSLDDDRTGAFLDWGSVDHAIYSLYRRTHHTPGRYDLVADSLEGEFYFDSGLEPDSGYGYVVLAHDTLSGRLSSHSNVSFAEAPPTPPSPSRFFSDIYADTLNNRVYPHSKEVVAFQRSLTLAPGEEKTFRIIRGAARPSQADSLLDAARALTTYDMSEAVQANEAAYRDAPSLNTDDAARRMTYWSALNLLRQSLLPAEGPLSHSYFVNAREPTGGIDHAGQMLRESLAMLAYVLLDPERAQQSQRVYVEQQHADGYIPHRVGPYLRQTEPQGDERTSAAPWFNWVNAEIYAETQDRAFLEAVYGPGADFYRWWTRERDEDGDGLCEWGGTAALESTRQGSISWDQVSAPESVEALDLNAMLVQEARALAEMAEALGKSDSAAAWRQRAERRAQAIRTTFWHAEDAFFYHVDRNDNDFTAQRAGDLRRPEIIGFLPLWAGIATEEQAAALVETMTNPETFARPNGIPSLAAGDPGYDARGRWNGSIWLPWQYLVFRGLLNYGYEAQAKQVAERSTEQVTQHLRDLHTFWQRYNANADEAHAPQPYVGTGIVARMMKDAEALQTDVAEDERARKTTLQLGNHPNPFRTATEITYRLPESESVRLTVHDVLGRRVATLVDEQRRAGRHTLVWRPEAELSSGLFFCRLHTNTGTITRKVIRLR